MENFTDWWQGLTLPLKVYWSFAIPFTVIFVLQVVLTLVGGTHDDIPDNEVNADHGIGFQFFTLKNLVGFFTLFGWVGIASIDSGIPAFFTLLLAFVGGLLMMVIMATIVYVLAKANADGTMRISKAIGSSGGTSVVRPTGSSLCMVKWAVVPPDVSTAARRLSGRLSRIMLFWI